MTVPAPNRSKARLFLRAALLSSLITIFVSLLLTVFQLYTWAGYTARIGIIVTLLSAIASAGISLFENVLNRIQFRLIELIFTVVILGNALGWTASLLLTGNPNSSAPALFTYIAGLLLLLIGGGSLWAVWVATLLNIQDLTKRLCLQILGWLIIPAGCGIIFSISTFASAEPDPSNIRLYISTAVIVPSIAIIYYTGNLSTKAKLAGKKLTTPNGPG